MAIQEIYREGKERLERAGILEAELDAWYLLEHVTGISKASYYGNPAREIRRQEKEQYFYYIEERKKRIPLQHLTGEQGFMGLVFCVNRHVLIPRQDTEILVETALERMKPGMQILDMCTGSGCILLSLLKLCKAEGVTGTGTDISKEALRVAVSNAERLGIRAKFVQGDLFENIGSQKIFDMIVSNPPYIPTAVIDGLQEEVKLYDPYVALDGREDGLFFYRRIVKESISYIKRDGCLLFEIGCEQAEAVAGLMEKAGYKDIRVKKDLAGLDRVVYGMYNGE
ncbi:peptide chain release factor N(5)-glutamine methyltransferase [Lachnospiraceae bacterium MD308]|nr:peptide chain release factor N(5)-glutamine methyltransferase [Lachnospiraceae bacterium MD308]